MKTVLFINIMLHVICLSLNAQTVVDFVSVPNPDDLEVDKFGNIWVNYRVSLDDSEHRLAKITPTGEITDVIIAPHTLGQFGINDSIIWIAGEWGSSAYVYKYNHFGIRLDSIFMPYPTAIILDEDGTWYVTQNAAGKLTKVNPDKSTQVLASGFPLNHNLALARDENGMFYTCNLHNALVIKINPNTGTKTTIAELPTASPYSLGFLSYSFGNLYVPSFRHCIYKLDTIGTSFDTFVGTELIPGDVSGPVEAALLNTPISTYFSITGDTLYFTESGNNKIRMVVGLSPSTHTNEFQNFNNSFDIYPNPVKQAITVSFKGIQEPITKICIANIQGEILYNLQYTHQATLQEQTLTLDKLEKGQYLLYIKTLSGDVLSRPFIKL